MMPKVRESHVHEGVSIRTTFFHVMYMKRVGWHSSGKIARMYIRDANVPRYHASMVRDSSIPPDKGPMSNDQ